MNDMDPAYIRATRFQVTAYQGEVSSIIFYGKIEDGKRLYCMEVNPEMITAALAERERQVAEQVAALIKERDALQDELEKAKEALRAEEVV